MNVMNVKNNFHISRLRQLEMPTWLLLVKYNNIAFIYLLLIISGLHVANGSSHVSEIAKMSLRLLDTVKSFKIKHRPQEQLELRIGIHTGN